MKSGILTLDLGNTTLRGGYWIGRDLKEEWSIPVSGKVLQKELGGKFRMLRKEGGAKAAILASVVPQRTGTVLSLCRRILKIDCRILSAATPTGLKILYHDPEQVGADRIANAVAAYRLYGAPAIVVDFGTAVTFDIISEKFEYLGGVIAPGLKISTEALFRKAALLPRVRIAVPEQVVGKDTAAAIRSGVYYGIRGLVAGIINELKKELGWGKGTKLIATGGHAEMILSGGRLIQTIDPLLTLKGLFLIAKKL